MQWEKLKAEKKNSERNIHESKIALLDQKQILQTGIIQSKIVQRNSMILGILLFSLLSLVVFKNYRNLKIVNRLLDEKGMELKSALIHFQQTRAELTETERQMKIALEKASISRDLQEEVGSGLTKISILSELLLQNTGESKKQVSKISETAGSLLDKMSEIVWTMNSGNENLENLFNYLRKYCLDFFENSGINCNVDIDQKMKEITLTVSDRRNIFMTIKETLNNILKYSGASDVLIRAELQAGSVTVEISENGKGFDLAIAKNMGNGLRNMSRRMNEIKGTYRIETEPGKGSRTILKLNSV